MNTLFCFTHCHLCTADEQCLQQGNIRGDLDLGLCDHLC